MDMRLDPLLDKKRVWSNSGLQTLVSGNLARNHAGVGGAKAKESYLYEVPYLAGGVCKGVEPLG
jgi:hypothetical protein